MREMKKCHDEEKALELIDKHSFDMESVPTHLRSYSRIWEQALARYDDSHQLCYITSCILHSECLSVGFSSL